MTTCCRYIIGPDAEAAAESIHWALERAGVHHTWGYSFFVYAHIHPGDADRARGALEADDVVKRLVERGVVILGNS
jgi:hypothetical protein